MPQLTTSPTTDAAAPGRSDAIVWKVAAILVADRKAVQQVLDRGEADALEIGRAPRPDAFQVLKRRVEGDHGQGSGLTDRRA